MSEADPGGKTAAGTAWKDPEIGKASFSLPDPLTTREIEILEMIASGDSDGRIAERLFVTIATVKTHINNLYRRLDVRSRTQAVARGRDLGLVNQ